MNRRVAYLVKRFPRLSETFVLNEFLHVRELGVRATLFALMDPGEKVVHPAARHLMPEVRYLYVAGRPWHSAWRLLRGAAAQAASNPRGFVRVLVAVVAVNRSLPSLRHALEGLWLARELRLSGVDHLHAHFAHSPAAVAHMARLAGGPPFSFTAHAKDLYTTLPRNLAARVDAAEFVLTCTRFNSRFLRGLFPGLATPVHVVYHGTDLGRFTPSRRRPEPGLIVSVGRLVEKKGHAVAIEALRQMASTGAVFRCEVYGGGPLREELDMMVSDAGLRGVVSLHGARAQEEIAAAYSRAAVFVLAPVVLPDGDRDGIPNALVEAMASGVPVVSTRISGIPELIDHGSNGLLVEPDDARALAHAITSLLLDKELARRLASAGRRTVERNFDLLVNSRRVAGLLAGTPFPETDKKMATVA